MALPKITDNQIKESGVQSLPDKLTGTAAENKKKFDQLVQNVVKQQYNALIDALEASGGAKEIGANVNGIDATNIQGVLAALKTLIDDNKTSQDNTNSGVQAGLENVYTKGETDAKIKAVQDDVDANESAQNAVNSGVQTALNNRYTIAQADGKLDLKLDKTTGNELVKSISFNSDNGVFTITTLGGKTTTIDTMIEKLPVSFSIVGNKLRITADDGTYQEADLSAFVDTYTFSDTDTIDFSQSGKAISAAVKAGSIGKTHLQAEVMEEIEDYAKRAEEAEESADISAVAASTYLDGVILHKEQVAKDATAAATSASNAKMHADNAAVSAKSASGSSSYAYEYMTDAQKSADAAAESQDAAATSESNAQNHAEEASGFATESKRWAVGIDEDVENEPCAKYYAESAESWAVGGTGLADRGDEDENNAMYYAKKAKQYAVGENEGDTGNAKYYSDRAGMWAMGSGSETNNPDDTHNAQHYAQQAATAKLNAEQAAEAAAESASECADAVEKAAEAEESAQTARVWAVGYEYDYTAPGDTNNAKYWAGVAKANADAKQGNWAQGDENKPDYIFNRTHYTDVLSEGGTILAEKSVTFSSIMNSVLLSGVGTNQIREGGKYKIIWNGSAYTRVAYKFNNDITIGNASLIGTGGENTGEPFCLTDMSSTDCALYKETTSAETITVAVEGVREEVVKQLDPKYIKDMYYTESGEELLEPTLAIYVGGSQFKLADRLNLFEGNEYLVTINDVEYTATAKPYKADFMAGLSLGNAALGGESGKEDTGEPYLIVDLNESSADSFGYGVAIWFGDGSTGVTVGVATSGQIHQIPEKYIPGGAGGGGKDLLNENGIIKQEVLPEGYPYEKTELGEVVYVPEQVPDLETGGTLSGDIIVPEVGQTITVTCCGVDYSCVVNEGSMEGLSFVYCGNGAALGLPESSEPFFLGFIPGMGNMCIPTTEEVPDDFTVKVTAMDIKKTVSRIDLKYMPENYPYEEPEVQIVDETQINDVTFGAKTSLSCVNFPELFVNYEVAAAVSAAGDLVANQTEFREYKVEGDVRGLIVDVNYEGFGKLGDVTFIYPEYAHTVDSTCFFTLTSSLTEYLTVVRVKITKPYVLKKLNEKFIDRAIKNIVDGKAEGSVRTLGAEDSDDNPLGEFAFAEGRGSEATGGYSHAEGNGSTARGSASHAEGSVTSAYGIDSHAEGNGTVASGNTSHAEGRGTYAGGKASHAEGEQTIAKGDFQHVQGQYNIEDTENKYAHIVGNGYGVGAAKRSNAHTLDWDGNAWYAGSVEGTAIILKSSTEGSTKRFKITVDDSGTLTATEITT